MANANTNSVATHEPLVSRKRKLEDIMRNEPTRVTRYPILLSSTRQNIDVASNFFEVWVDDKYQEDLVYCQGCKKIASRQKRHNSNLVLHLKRHNQCNAALSLGVDAPQETGSTSKRDGDSTCSKSEVDTCDGEGVGASSGSAGEVERKTGFTSPTASVSTSPVPEVESNSSTSQGAGVALRFIIRGHSPSAYHIEAAPSDANLSASRTTQEEQTPTSPLLMAPLLQAPLLQAAPLQAPPLHSPLLQAPLLQAPLLQAAPLQAALLSTQSLFDPQYGLDSDDEESQDQPSSQDPDSAQAGQVGGGRKRRTQFIEIDCRRAFRDSLLCKTFKPVDEDADLNTVLFSFRDVIRRELARILAEHPGVKAWIGVTNLYDYKNKGVERELSIKTSPLFISSEDAIDSLIEKVETYIVGRNSSFTVLGSDLDYVRNINITLNIAEWDIRAAGGWSKRRKL